MARHAGYRRVCSVFYMKLRSLYPRRAKGSGDSVAREIKSWAEEELERNTRGDLLTYIYICIDVSLSFKQVPASKWIKKQFAMNFAAWETEILFIMVIGKGILFYSVFEG